MVEATESHRVGSISLHVHIMELNIHPSMLLTECLGCIDVSNRGRDRPFSDFAFGTEYGGEPCAQEVKPVHPFGQQFIAVALLRRWEQEEWVEYSEAEPYPKSKKERPDNA
jgi:hypothetical protein